MLCLVLFSQVAIAGPIYRCMDADGVTRFTDRGCAGQGERIEESAIHTNVYTAEPSAETTIESPRPDRPARRQTGCDNAADLRHIDLLLDSLTTDKRQRRFLKAERKRVLNCALENLSFPERRLRDAALSRTDSLRASEREAAELEIEGLYGVHRPRKGSRKR
ncbi:MAG: DUF4124 domain-containing protein [Nevskiales bacterium]